MKKQSTLVYHAGRVATALLAGALLLSACGGTTPAATSSTNAAAVTEAATEAAASDTAAATTAPADTATTETATAATVASTKLNLNTVTQDELTATIPNFGSRMVREFMEYRPYASILQFRKEIGKYVDAAQVAEYEKYVFVPVSPNDSDEATLQQIPGITADVAAQLVAGRPYESTAVFLDKLGQLIPADQAAAAAAYLGD